MRTERRVQSISYAVRPRFIGAYLGYLAILLGLLSLLPLLFALSQRDWLHASGYGLAVAILLGGGSWLHRLNIEGELQTNEALVVVCAAFVLAPLLLAVPMMTTGVGFLDALFEAISGITTTGLSTLVTVQDKPPSLLFTAAWLQWLGGMGIIVLSFALLFGQGVNSKRLTGVLAEQPSLIGGTRTYAAIVIRYYAVLTLVGIGALWLAGGDWFAAVILALTSVSTGGFSPFNTSLGDLGHMVQGLVMLLCVAGAIAMPLFHTLLKGDWRDVLGDAEIRALLIAVCLGVALLWLERGGIKTAGGGPSLWEIALLAVSAQTTAGFSTFPAGDLGAFSKLVVIFSMAVGGGVGSTAGGIKLLRFLVLLRILQLLILRTRLPSHGVASTSLGGKVWSNGELVRVLSFISLFAGAVLLSWLPFLWYGYDPLDALFEVVSAMGTVGLSTGIVGPALEPALKGLLCLDMVLGRLEVLAVLVFLAPRTWIGHHRQSGQNQLHEEVAADETALSRSLRPDGNDSRGADRGRT